MNAPVPLRAAVKVSAADLLQTYGHGSLQQMSSIRGYGTQGNKSKLAETLAKTLYRPERIAAALKALTEVERHVLDRLILVGGEVATAVLRDQLEAEDAIGPRPQSGW
ncbi:MAG: hypothetical protein M3Z66_10085, partial [Chloroflexota bacterium]|nr:hypothetical protein [Chloroflexota bacterium]